MNTQPQEALTFRVMTADGSTLNKVMHAENENDFDPIEVAVEKRRLEAIKKAQRWSTTYYQQETVRVVPCDAFGKPL